MSKTSRLVASSAFIALGVMLPMIFHFVGASGSIFLPMHIPVLIAGLFLGPYAGFMVGILSPLLSSFFTGMPPFMPILPIMLIELGIYGASSGYLYRCKGCSLLVSLLCSMILGRIAAICIVYVMVSFLHINLQLSAYLIGAVITGLPGVCIQLILIPFLVKRLQFVLSK